MLNYLKPNFAKDLVVSCFGKFVYEGNNKKKYISRAQNTLSSCGNYIEIQRKESYHKIKRAKIIPVYTI